MKLTEQQKQELSKLGIDDIDTKDQAFDKLSKLIEDFDIPISKDDDIDDIIAIAKEFVEPSVDNKQEISSQESADEMMLAEDEEVEKLAEEVSKYQERKKRQARSPKSGKRKKAKNIQHLDPSKEEDYNELKGLLSYFEEQEGFWIKKIKSGVSVYVKQENGHQVLFCYRTLQKRDGKIQGLFYANRFKDKQEFVEEIIPLGCLTVDRIYQYKPSYCLHLVSIPYETVLEIVHGEGSRFIKESLNRIKHSNLAIGRRKEKLGDILEGREDDEE